MRLLNSIGRVKKPMWLHKKTTCHILIVILLICTTVYSDWTLFRQQMSSIVTTSNVGDDFDITSKEEDNRYGISWEWKRYRSTTGSSDSLIPATHTATRKGAYKKILIAQYDAGDGGGTGNHSSYAMLLNITSRINQLYAFQYQLDYVLLRGIVFRTFYESLAQIPTSRATYNKIYIVQKAIEWNYDYLLLLDSDAMIYDFNRDITQLLLPPHKMIVAHQVGGHNNNNNNNQNKEYYNINIGVTLWNIRHTMVRTIVRRWKMLCYLRIIFQLDDNDQNPLQNIFRYFVTFGRSLSSTNEYLHTNIIEENHNDFAYRGGTFVKHFIRYNSKTWIQEDHHRIEEISKVANEICVRHEPMCNSSSVP
jgi:hypothetical protein